MPSFPDLQFLSGTGVLLGLIITAALVVLIADWRLALFALAFQYVFLGLLLTSILQPAVVSVRIIAGGLASAILYLSMHNRAEEERAAQASIGQTASGGLGRPMAAGVFIVGFPFRFFAVALVAVAIIGLSSSMTLLGLPSYVVFSSLWLMAVGILIAMLSRDALRLGLGILIFTGGFGIVDTAIEGSLFLYGLLNIADLLIALVIAHLATLPSESGQARRRRDLP